MEFALASVSSVYFIDLLVSVFADLVAHEYSNKQKRRMAADPAAASDTGGESSDGAKEDAAEGRSLLAESAGARHTDSLRSPLPRESLSSSSSSSLAAAATRTATRTRRVCRRRGPFDWGAAAVYGTAKFATQCLFVHNTVAVVLTNHWLLALPGTFIEAALDYLLPLYGLGWLAGGCDLLLWVVDSTVPFVWLLLQYVLANELNAYHYVPSAPPELLQGLNDLCLRRVEWPDGVLYPSEAAALQRPFRPGAPAAVIVDGIAVAVGVQQKPLLLSTSPVSMIVLEPNEVRQQVISKPAAAGGGATALYKVTPFDGGFGGDDAKDELENTAL